jgi:hypothetical protein
MKRPITFMLFVCTSVLVFTSASAQFSSNHRQTAAEMWEQMKAERSKLSTSSNTNGNTNTSQANSNTNDNENHQQPNSGFRSFPSDGGSTTTTISNDGGYAHDSYVDRDGVKKDIYHYDNGDGTSTVVTKQTDQNGNVTRNGVPVDRSPKSVDKDNGPGDHSGGGSNGGGADRGGSGGGYGSDHGPQGDHGAASR